MSFVVYLYVQRVASFSIYILFWTSMWGHDVYKCPINCANDIWEA